MKKLGFKIVLLCLPLALLSGWLESNLRSVPNSYNQKWTLLEPRLKDLRVLVLGASQENQGLTAGLLDQDAFNLACVGQDYYYDRQLALKVLARAPKLRLVVLSLSYVSLGYQLPRSPESWRQFSYRLYDGLPDEDPEARWDLRNYSALAFTEPGPALADALNGFKGETGVVFGPDGQQRVQALDGDQLDFAINEFTARKRLRYLTSILREEDVPANLGLLSSLLATLRQKGVHAVFITSPVSGDFRQVMDGKTWERHRAEIVALAAGFRVPYHDHLADPRFDENDFSDTDHLNVRGAAKFTRILRAELDRDGLLGPGRGAL